MSRHHTTLKEHSTGAKIAAIVDDFVPFDQLFQVEEQWCLARVQVLRELSSARVDENDWPQSLHWNWAEKAAKSNPAFFEGGDTRLFGVEQGGQWQGVLLAWSEGHFARRGSVGQPLVYVDFLEIAPWNWHVPQVNRVGRFRGIGTQLIELAIRWSLSLGFEGRIGLHSLPQAEHFYARRCGMKNLGVDLAYHDLCYLELTEVEAQEYLRRLP